MFTHAYTCSHMPTLPKCLFQCLFHFMYVYPAHSMNRCLLAGGPRPIHMNVPLQPTLRHLLHVHHAYLNQNAYLNAYSSLCLYPSTRIEPVCLLAGGPRPNHLNVPLQPDLRQFLHVHTCLHMFTHAYLTKMFISMPIPFYVCIPSTLHEPVPTSWRSTTHSHECAIATNLTTFAACSPCLS